MYEHVSSFVYICYICFCVSEQTGNWWNLPSWGKKWTRQILNEVSFHVDSGQIMGILGNSGEDSDLFEFYSQRKQSSTVLNLTILSGCHLTICIVELHE